MMSLYYLKIVEGFHMEVQFDNVQGLNLFHKKAKSPVSDIDGVVLHQQTVKAKRMLEIIPLLYMTDEAQFKDYKFILSNHIQSILNFYTLRHWDPFISPESSDTSICHFEGGKDKLTFDDFLDSRKFQTLQDLQDQLPIRSSVDYLTLTDIVWKRFSQSPLWNNYLQIKNMLHDCNGSQTHPQGIIPFHAQVMNFKRFEKVHYLSMTDTIREKFKFKPCCKQCHFNCFPICSSF